MKHLLRESLKLCLVTNIKQQSMDEYLIFIKRAVMGGVSMVQLREKGDDFAEVRQKAIALKNLLHEFRIPLIINDFVNLAAEIGAAGVHIGPHDMSISEARKILGPNKIIGYSIETLEDLNRINKEDVNYVTASAIYPSKTKPECNTIWGLDGLRSVVTNSKHPVTAIGGINTRNAGDIFSAGAVGVAVVGAIHDPICPHQASQELINVIKNVQKQGCSR